MRTLQEIETDIARVKEELRDVHGTTTEVYARIVGYYRSVRNWNRGKREEYNHRKLFVAENNTIESHLPGNREKNTVPAGMQTPVETAVPEQAAPSVPAAPAADTDSSGTAARYELFVRKTCPNCPPVKKCCTNLPFDGEQIDVDTDEGLIKAQEYGIFSTPTVVFFDEAGRETGRAHSTREIHTQLPAVEETLA